MWKSALAGALALPAVALAHAGHGTAEVLVEVVEARQVGHEVRLSAYLTNLGDSALQLTGIAAGGASIEGAAFPLTIPGDGTLRISAGVVYDGTVPGILTLDFAFGAEGSGPIVVVPEAQGDDDV